MRYRLAFLAMMSLVPAMGPARGEPAGPAGQVVLDTGSYWRYCMAYRTELVRRASGELETLDSEEDKAAPLLTSKLPPADWASPAFDDGTWARRKGPVPAHSAEIALVCLRGRFEVKDPAAVGDMRLSLGILGGAVVYLNGREIARTGLPPGKLALHTPALDYPEEAYLTPEGFLYRNSFGDPEKYEERLRSRIRALHDVAVPASALVRGTNVLAVEIHRAPASELLLTKRTVDARREAWRGRNHYWWSRAGFKSLSLTTTSGMDAVVPNVGPPAGLTVWNQPICQRVSVVEHGESIGSIRPMLLSGPRNSALGGQVVAGSDAPIRSLKAAASGLERTAGGGSVPSSALDVWYLRPDGPTIDRRRIPVFDTMSPVAPAEVAVHEMGGVATQPIWLTVRVPRDAEPGTYSGKLTISAEGAAPIEVPLVLKLHDWVMPDPEEFVSHVGLIQSPESVAMQYDVGMWSDRHWKLMDRSFDLMGQVGSDCVFLYLMRRTHFGNEHGMVRWIRRPDGGYEHDFSIAERYLDLAVRHLGRPEVVGLYLWEAFTQGSRRHPNKGVPITILDSATGELEEGWGPKWGSPEAREFWKPVVDGLREILDKRGLADAMMFGVSTDAQPDEAVIEDLKAVAPDVPWISRGHVRPSNLYGVPVGYVCDVWGSPVAPDPSEERRYGWQNPWLRATFPRAGSNTVGAMRPWAPLAMWYVSLEGMSAAGIRGFGSMGADFWDVLRSDDPLRNPYGGGWIHNIIGRYPESAYGQVYMGNSSPYVLGPGPDGALPTVRFEMIRAAAQVTAARTFVEKALLDPDRKAGLGPELAGRAQKLLDERARAVLWARKGGWLWFPSSGWQQRDDALYALCAEVANSLGQ